MRCPPRLSPPAVPLDDSGTTVQQKHCLLYDGGLEWQKRLYELVGVRCAFRELLRCRTANAVEEGTVNFLFEERGQDITEYSLLLAFVVLAAIGIFLVSSQSIMGIWTAGNQVISSANTVAHGS